MPEEEGDRVIIQKTPNQRSIETRKYLSSWRQVDSKQDVTTEISVIARIIVV